MQTFGILLLFLPCQKWYFLTIYVNYLHTIRYNAKRATAKHEITPLYEMCDGG